MIQLNRKSGLTTIRRTLFRLKAAKARKWIKLSQQIQGWLTEVEAAELFYLARRLTPANGPRVVELGSWQGKSSVILAGGLLGKKEARLYCVDPFGCDENSEYQKKYYDPLVAGTMETGEQIFSSNLKKSGVAHIVTPLKGYSFEFADTWSVPIDLLFIDANHEYESVARDFQMWVRHVKRGGIVAFHDANGVWPGPTRVVEESLIATNFGRVHKADSVAWASKRFT
jgi:predicted O-methyltransferase YrrM